MQIQAAFQFCHLCRLRQPTFSPIPQKLIKFASMKPQDKYRCYQATSIAFENVKASHRRGKANLRSIHRPNSNCNYGLEMPSLISDPCENLVAKAWLLAWESPEPACQIFTTFSEPPQNTFWRHRNMFHLPPMIVTFFSANFSKSDWKPCPSAVQPGVSASGSKADSAGKYL